MGVFPNRTSIHGDDHSLPGVAAAAEQTNIISDTYPWPGRDLREGAIKVGGPSRIELEYGKQI